MLTSTARAQLDVAPPAAALPVSFRRCEGGVTLTVPLDLWPRLRPQLFLRLEKLGPEGDQSAADALYHMLEADEEAHPDPAVALAPWSGANGEVAVLGDPSLGDADAEPGRAVTFTEAEWTLVKAGALHFLLRLATRGGVGDRALRKLRGR